VSANPSVGAAGCVVVTDGLWRKSLSAIRSLGKAGFQVAVMGDSVFTTGFWSRYTRRRIRAPLASQDAEGFGGALLHTLEELAHGAGRPVLVPMEDASLMWISRHRQQVAACADLLLAPADSLAVAQDKAATVRVAREIGLPCPQTWAPASVEELCAHVAHLEPGGFVVKPRTGSGSAGVVYGEPRTAEVWRREWERQGPLLIQERIPAAGAGQGVGLLMDGAGSCVAAFAHERLREYPNSGGPSTDRRSIHAPQLVEWSIALLQRLSWRGIAMTEWKVDVRDGTPKLMEINPRFWGSLELAVRAGVDFPVLYARAARGDTVRAPADYADGVRCRWMMPGEILRYLSAARREPLRAFIDGLPRSAEEWDSTDLRGALATLVCTGAHAFDPRYWRYVRRG
jgi:predicted ATP-grasp superfamily ATP-dependent carboligase